MERRAPHQAEGPLPIEPAAEPTGKPTRGELAALAAILAGAAALRAYRIGALSFWYDEVVTVRLARASGPGALLRLLGQIDATRAPLHPLLLQRWVAVFGPSEAATRALSAACGVAVVALTYRLGRRLYGHPATALLAAALAALCPPLVAYSQETRMYAWLVLVTCVAWDTLSSLASGATPGRLVLLAATLAALGYSHPLGLIMAAALGLAALQDGHALHLSWASLAAPFTLAGLALAPWVSHYLDHEPESTVGRLPLRFLLGMPIGYLGGNFVTLAGFGAVIVFGLTRLEKDAMGHWRVGLDRPSAATRLLVWLLFPPVVLYLYSRLAHPIFGPERYTLFVAPAYLILVARGVARLPRVPRAVVAAATVLLAATALPARVYAPDLKADWRAAAAQLRRLDPGQSEPLVVASADPSHNVEVETARYYLGPDRHVIPRPPTGRVEADGAGRVWYAFGVRDGRPVADPPPAVQGPFTVIDLPGLRLVGTRPGHVD